MSLKNPKEFIHLIQGFIKGIFKSSNSLIQILNFFSDIERDRDDLIDLTFK